MRLIIQSNFIPSLIFSPDYIKTVEDRMKEKSDMYKQAMIDYLYSEI